MKATKQEALENIPEPLSPAAAARLKELCEKYGVRRIALYTGVTRYSVAVAAAGLRLRHDVQSRLDAAMQKLADADDERCGAGPAA